MALIASSSKNPYGLQALWAQGDFIARDSSLLALMSAYSWFIIFTKWWSSAGSSSRRSRPRRTSGGRQHQERRHQAHRQGQHLQGDRVRGDRRGRASRHPHDPAGAAARVDRQRHRARVARIGSACRHNCRSRYHGLDRAVIACLNGVGHLSRAGRHRCRGQASIDKVAVPWARR